jgi:regulator of sigma D
LLRKCENANPKNSRIARRKHTHTQIKETTQNYIDYTHSYTIREDPLLQSQQNYELILKLKDKYITNI